MVSLYICVIQFFLFWEESEPCISLLVSFSYPCHIYLTVFAKTCQQLTLRRSLWPGVFLPPPWLGEYPPRKHVTGTSPAATQNIQASPNNSTSTVNNKSLTERRCPCKTAFPAPCFWQMAPCKPPADSPCTGPSTWTRLDGAPLGLGRQLGLLRACSCEYG